MVQIEQMSDIFSSIVSFFTFYSLLFFYTKLMVKRGNKVFKKLGITTGKWSKMQGNEWSTESFNLNDAYQKKRSLTCKCLPVDLNWKTFL